MSRMPRSTEYGKGREILPWFMIYMEILQYTIPNQSNIVFPRSLLRVKFHYSGTDVIAFYTGDPRRGAAMFDQSHAFLNCFGVCNLERFETWLTNLWPGYVNSWPVWSQPDPLCLEGWSASGHFAGYTPWHKTYLQGVVDLHANRT